MSDLTKSLVAPNGVKIELNTGLFINNEFVPGSAPKLETIDPAKGEVITSVESASASNIDQAINAARTAFHNKEWRNIAPAERGGLLTKLAALVEEHREALATLETWDNGKPYQVSFDEDLTEVVSTLRYYAGWADKLAGSTIYKSGYYQMKLGYTLKQPIGVCAQIIPWNYPLAMASWKIAPAIACGNTVVIKAAEQTPLSILYLAKLIAEAGFPPGVINVVNGLGKEAGQALVSSPKIDKIAFTGSTTTGKHIMRAAAANMTNITLETGGKSPLVVFEDADLQQAAKWAYIGIMSNQGQVCTATSRIIVHKKVKDQFLELFQKEIEANIVVGNPFTEGTTHGPQVSDLQYEKILGFMKRGQEAGAKAVVGGSAYEGEGTKNGYFIQPTVFDNVTRGMEIFQEEVFGPVAAVTTFEGEEEAIDLANDSEYGLSAAVFSSNVETAHRVAELLEAGTVWINSSQDNDIRIPFGGVKRSGIGRELGESVLHAYTEEKAVHVNLGLKIP